MEPTGMLDVLGLALPANAVQANFEILNEIVGNIQSALAALENSKVTGIEVTIDGGGAAISTGVKAYTRVPFDCEIEGVTLLADQTGSIAVDVWRDDYANFPPTDADSITASAVPTITTGVKYADTTLTGWNLSITAGQVLGFHVDSCTDIERCHLILTVRKS